MYVNRKDKNTDKKHEWRVALADVEREILKSERRMRQLRRSANIIRSKIEANEPWPGSGATQSPLA